MSFYYLTEKAEQRPEEIEEIYESFGLEGVETLEIQGEAMDAFLREGDFQGVIIGRPYGLRVQKYADEEAFGALRCSAINLLYREGEAIYADNTDWLAILQSLNTVHAKLNGKKVLVLGRGAAAKAVREAMKERHAGLIWQIPSHEIPMIGKKPEAEILVNATPVEQDVDLDLFPHLELVLDLLPKEETKLIRRAKRRGIPVIDGKTVFRLQAEITASILQGIE